MQGRQKEASKAHKVSALTELLSNAEKDVEKVDLVWIADGNVTWYNNSGL